MVGGFAQEKVLHSARELLNAPKKPASSLHSPTEEPKPCAKGVKKANILVMKAKEFIRPHFASLFFALGLLLAPASGQAYEEKLHSLISEQVFPEEGDLLLPPSEEELDEFRVLLFEFLSRSSREDTREVLAAMVPDEEVAADAWRLKAYLLLNTSAPIYGIDHTPDEALSEKELLSLASRWPDDDKRNQDRFLFDGDGTSTLPDGSPRPADPAILHMGNSTGLSSQAHAHYALYPGQRSDDPEVLKTEPWLFSIPPNARTFGVDYALIYERLATIARGIDHPASRWVSLAFEGNAMHHIQDVCNQIHTVQVGDYEFFYHAAKQRLVQDFRTVGGLFGERLSLKELGVRYLTNYHLLVEELMSREMQAASENPEEYPEGAELIAALNAPDHEHVKEQIKSGLLSNFSASEAVMYPLINMGAIEVPHIYRLARFLGRDKLMEVGGIQFVPTELEESLKAPLSELRQTAHYREFFAFHRDAMHRCATALRNWRSYPRQSPEETAEKLVEQLASLHQEVNHRNLAWTPESGEEEEGLNYLVIGVYTAGLLIVLSIVGLLVVYLRHRRKA